MAATARQRTVWRVAQAQPAGPDVRGRILSLIEYLNRLQAK
jgi:hypothetical protein